MKARSLAIRISKKMFVYNGELYFGRKFAVRAHTQSVRSVRVGGKYLVSGGADEIIKIFNLKKNVQIGCIEKHTGNITDLAFLNDNYLFSASKDGLICIYKTKGWQCEKTFDAHPGGVTGISVHPSGKLALSVGEDRKLYTWNLIKGRKAFTTNTKVVANSVHWNPAGDQFVVVKDSCVDIYEVSTGQVKQSVDFKEIIHALVFLTDDIIAVGGEGKNICLYDITNLIELTQWPAHSMRIKTLCNIPRLSTGELWLASGSTDGIIKIWSIQMLSVTGKPRLLGQVDTSCRIICMDIYVANQKISIKEEESEPKEGEEEVDEVEDELGDEEDEEEDSEDEVKEEKDDDSDGNESYESFLEDDEDIEDMMDYELEDSMNIKEEDVDESEQSEEERKPLKRGKKKKNSTTLGKEAKKADGGKKSTQNGKKEKKEIVKKAKKNTKSLLSEQKSKERIPVQTVKKSKKKAKSLETKKGSEETKPVQNGEKGENGTSLGKKVQKRKKKALENKTNTSPKKAKKMKVN